MLFYNIEILEKVACNSPTKMLQLLQYHYSKSLPKNKYKLPTVSLYGSSFLINPKYLLEDNATDINYKVQYIRLSARRDYILYKQYGYRGLNTSFYPDLNYEAIKHNPLLTVTKKEIVFIYEELN